MKVSKCLAPNIEFINKISETGRHGTLNVSYADILKTLGKPNATYLDDPDKVKASWGFKDKFAREAFIWCYRYKSAKDCDAWSICGDFKLLDELFPGKASNKIY